MSARVSVIIVCDVCDVCDVELPRGTVAGARGDADRKGWRVSRKGDPRAGLSNDWARIDHCPACRTDKPRADVGLFAGADS